VCGWVGDGGVRARPVAEGGDGEVGARVLRLLQRPGARVVPVRQVPAAGPRGGGGCTPAHGEEFCELFAPKGGCRGRKRFLGLEGDATVAGIPREPVGGPVIQSEHAIVLFLFAIGSPLSCDRDPPRRMHGKPRRPSPTPTTTRHICMTGMMECRGMGSGYTHRDTHIQTALSHTPPPARSLTLRPFPCHTVVMGGT